MEHMGITNVHRFQMVSTDSSLRMRPQDPRDWSLVKRNVCDRGWLAQQWFFQEKACEKIGG